MEKQQNTGNASTAIDIETGTAAESILVTEAGEKQQRLEILEEKYGSTWVSIDDPEDPYNWSSRRKIGTGILVSLSQLVTLMSASMMVSALPIIGTDLGIDSTKTQLTFTTYFLGLGFGPFIVAAISEMSGRKPIWVAANCWYIFWNAICPVRDSVGVMVAGRLLSGMGASVGITLTGPIMADMYGSADRGKSIALASFMPYLGPALGPIIGGVATERIDWHWFFWILSIVSAVVTALGMVFIRESYTPQILRSRAAVAVRASNSNDDHLSPQENHPNLQSQVILQQAFRIFLTDLWISLRRPIKLLISRPVLIMVSLLLAIDFGIYTIMLSTFATLWLEIYHESQVTSSLNYIAIAIGSTVSTQLGGHTMDWIYKKLSERSPDRKGQPEFRMPYAAIGSLFVPVGLFWYAWSGEEKIIWIMVDIGAGVFTLGSFLLSQAFLAYLIDEFSDHAASANASSRLLSYVFGFAFPLFTPSLYTSLGFGWGNSLLAFLSVGLICPVPLIFWVYGKKLRAIGKSK